MRKELSKKEILQKEGYDIVINVTEFRKRLNYYLDLAIKKKIIITRYRGDKMQFYMLVEVKGNIE